MRWAAFVVLSAMVMVASSCADRPKNEAGGRPRPAGHAAMLKTLKRYGIRDQRILDAMAVVDREHFIPTPFRRGNAYGDHPLPIGHGQTISQPYIVAYMTAKMNLHPGEKVLEIGTGSGYQAAILAELGVAVYSIEIVPELATHARAALKAAGYGAVRVLTGNGYKGWPDHAPFDAIIVTCAPDDVPDTLVEQLKGDGRMIVPVGSERQRLVILHRQGNRIVPEQDIPVRFVPMVEAPTSTE